MYRNIIFCGLKISLNIHNHQDAPADIIIEYNQNLDLEIIESRYMNNNGLQ